MNSRESIVKIVTQYFAPMTKKPFEFRNKIYEPKELRVSPMIFTRKMTCVPGCGGCCAKLSVEYIMPEWDVSALDEGQDFLHADGTFEKFNARMIYVNGISKLVLSDLQKNNKDHFCHYLQQDTGLCNIHGRHPFSCDFELIRFSLMSRPDRANQLNHRPFGRGWAMLTVDGTRGAKCEWEDTEAQLGEQQAEVIRKLKRLKLWMEYWEIDHKVDRVIDWVSTGPHTEPLFV